LHTKLMKAKSTKDTRKMVQQFTDLLNKCLALDPTRRIALKDALRDEFFATTTPAKPSVTT
jgi:serine/threonine protein kinase